MLQNLKIGDEVLIRADSYHARRTGILFRKAIIKSETRISWIVGLPTYGHADFKVPKKTLKGIFDEDSARKSIWVSENFYKIGQAVGCIRDFEKLQKIASIIGFNAPINELKVQHD